ncbi:uncharacterized protein LOC124544079 [Vanessa cardui]|uniref:uncharacterized protein LOC124544079 n=1 Tax=Vanessa cardui TaxID=171605 RepID=UPI001F140812|nr:uncharacterized protein LOC124544079 [Vanessa cardui]XP_046978455.1 uncharacterized protein LOC124544079 [Vanessa cardui]XP_046978456.1 uncharacterized protein LOC124544079 [Vanessa cardui]XP_046978457.1 uncharacterized protein LOC124544079 [Vanessa cardui]
MEVEKKVFSSTIIRTQNHIKNNLQEILNIVPATPVVDKLEKVSDCNFIHKTDKYYVPKKKNGMKVKTVQDIRKIFEADINSYLPDELEKQKNMLLRKIRLGSSKDEETKEIARKMLKSSSPISRSAWQMLININPNDQKFAHQYVRFNGKYIQVNGSKGGNSKFICKHDIGKIKELSVNNSTYRRNNLKKKKALLQNSLNVKFKPGPLTKKKCLDNSYQKHQFGDMAVVTLPKPGLDIQPSYGKPLAPVINTFLQNTFLLNSDGVISPKWADFAVTVLGTNEKGIPVQSKDSCNVTFDLDYKCFQNRILMRNDSDIIHLEKVQRVPIQTTQDDSVILSEVISVVDNIIDAVEISLNQDAMFFGEDETREEIVTNSCSNTNHLKEKGKRKYGELDRLDVTVIRISDKSELNAKNVCSNAHCTLGCICDSLNYSYGLKIHCGRFECMFQCKCDYSNYRLSDSFDNDCTDILPGLVNLDQKLGQTLAKEEQKFHQTVIVTDDKSIVLKSQKRNWKTSKKYAEFYSNMRLKTKDNAKKTLSVLCTNLVLNNVEPWCMVHNLYKCFCKGKFTKSFTPGVEEPVNTNNKIPEKIKKVVINIDLTRQELSIDTKANRKRSIYESNESSLDSFDYFESVKCIRTLPYRGRKHCEEYYHTTNKKILEMERNDKTLRKKLASLINKEDSQENIVSQNVNTPVVIDSTSNDLLNNVIEQIPLEYKDVKKLSSTKLVTWLESNYKQYKERTNQGPIKHSLHPPRLGTMALYPWDFILDRYREKKNYFLISKQQPYRIFMAVNVKNALFDNCININDIALSDLDKYPITVKNLLTNATDLKDNFCILCGLSHCWELVGSVTKVNNNRSNVTQENEIDTIISQRPKSQSECSSDLEFMPVITDNSSDELNCSLENVFNQTSENTPEQSKWFVMTVENDFTEIRFYKRGFFVKYESIIKAINVAKVSGKTVKLSSQNCSYPQTNPSFGIYAIPSDVENYVFIGPYEKDEALGIETIRNMHDVRKSNSTRGRWITTNKIDNLNVIDNPLMYMPSSNADSNNMLSLDTDSCSKDGTNEYQQVSDKSTTSTGSNEKTDKGVVGKVVKPIRIRKTNGFFQLAPNGLLKQVPLQNKDKLKYKGAFLVKKNMLINKDSSSSNAPLLNSPLLLRQYLTQPEEPVEKGIMLQKQKPVQEIANQAKTLKNVGHTNDLQKRKLEGGMLILKPEEINQRSFQNQLLCGQEKTNNQESIDSMDMDIEEFLEKSVVNKQTQCYVISDDEDESISNPCTKDNTCKDVWIVCKNVENLGWIPGRRNSENELSFEFPGFKYTEFYKEDEAFNKITQVMSRKMYIPRHIHLEWHALESLPDSNIKKKLKAKDLTPDYMLIQKGFHLKSELSKNIKSKRNVDSPSTALDDIVMHDLTDKNNIMTKLNETSDNLEDESLVLWNKTMAKKREILKSFSKASEDLRKELIDQLNNIKSNAEDSE